MLRKRSGEFTAVIHCLPSCDFSDCSQADKDEFEDGEGSTTVTDAETLELDDVTTPKEVTADDELQQTLRYRFGDHRFGL